MDEPPQTRTDKVTSALGSVFAVLAAAGILVIIVALLFALAYGAVRVAWSTVTQWPNITGALVSFVSDRLVALGPWAAALVAACSVGVLAHTNRSRAREAVNNDFRDFMQWALENVNQADDDAAKLFAFSVIEQFAKEPPRNLHKRNKTLATEVYEALTRDLADDMRVSDQLSLDLTGESEDTEDTPGEGSK